MEMRKKMKKTLVMITFVLFLSISVFSLSCLAQTLSGQDFVRLGKMTTLTGTLVQEGEEWMLKVGDTIYEIHLGPSEYMKQKGLVLKSGEEAKVRGFVYETNVAVVSIETSGKSIILRDEKGSPAWGGTEYTKGKDSGKK